MNKLKYCLASLFFVFASVLMAQDGVNADKEPGHYNQSKFKQLYEEFATPNNYRSASGAPGPDYYQQQADYKMDIELDDKNAKIFGTETITYTNNSPDDLEYLWLQLDQNVRAKTSKSPLRDGGGVPMAEQVGSFAQKYMTEPFDGGFNIEYVKDASGKPLKYTINQTMMRIDIPKPLKSKEKISFSIKWDYNIPDHTVNRARSGYEYFPKDGNRAYVIAQFFPRMAVYSDVEGWQNHQFWGSGEFALTFGDYDVNITVPADHVLDATGTLQNRKDVFTKEMMARYEKAKKSYDKPVVIVTQEEAEKAEKGFSKKKKTWKFKAENVRDYAFATSRKFIWDMQAVKVGSKDVMAVSLYPKEGNPLWEEYSTKAVAHTLKSYSSHTFDYPYPKAISVHAKQQGMEYPMICWNYGRPNEDGTYSDRVKFGMISVIIHEVGHNFFPMIVNSDERQWGWMDEGLDTFMQYMAEQEFGEKYPEAIAPNSKYPSRRGEPSKIVPYMAGDQSSIAPIMSNPENVYQLGPNAYGKPATALNILRETVMGRELFDHAFKTYAQRWMFKHPTPEDFFRTMEDASAVDLDWYWRGWFYTTDFVDIGVKGIKKYYVTDKPSKKMQEYMAVRGITEADLPPLVYLAEEGSDDLDPNLKGKTPSESSQSLKEFMMDNMTAEERAAVKEPKYIYQVTYDKPGGIPMPLIVEYTYADGSTKNVTYPPEIWRKNDKEVSVVISSQSELTGIVVDPKAETADIDTSNNAWPKKEEKSDFEKMKENAVKGK
ncbi:M1 family metallopeptidase [Zobellia galactanivorans]|uniref:M1 family metallopeptidase n=1 Tax=Zobellia galactanivorans (strain DSM 12802 / CCUG 47099 / CIP 106680 / NCIMB 13871 / Dsij) TaxID=63186 RepID=UPI001C06CF90|nr:M1 family metallopeptidase [Zobellia galactanivorans]MBU3027362.1 M1 family metallopeptidase [Zobellia galactanivorans]MDO6809539.1 M1 family metallopeptidase [Zobellia galactanivorans]